MSTKNIFINPEIAQEITIFLQDKNYTKVGVLLDQHTKKHCYKLLKPFLPKHTSFTIPAGEEHKNLETCSQIWAYLTEQNFDRKSVLLNLGGGVIGDMGGFCAGTFKRGIDFIQIPTTLLAQADASVGGKTGIDFEGFKNHIGVFSQPAAVFIYTQFFKTLNPRELRSGFAEIIKHCLIRDRNKWEVVRRTELDAQDWVDLVRHSVEIKAQITTEDPTEKGLRKILNFGHTIGHAIESFFLNLGPRKLMHGEAIAVGMICESYVSHNRGLLTDAELEQIEEMIYSIYGKVIIEIEEIKEIAKLALQDKKNERGKIRTVLLDGIGKAIFDQDLSLKEIEDALAYYNN